MESLKDMEMLHTRDEEDASASVETNSSEVITTNKLVEDTSIASHSETTTSVSTSSSSNQYPNPTQDINPAQSAVKPKSAAQPDNVPHPQSATEPKSSGNFHSNVSADAQSSSSTTTNLVGNTRATLTVEKSATSNIMQDGWTRCLDLFRKQKL